MSAMETNGSSVGYDARPTALVNGGMVELRGKTLQLLVKVRERGSSLEILTGCESDAARELRAVLETDE